MELLAHLEAYVAVVEEASFSRAADRVGVAQPLLSRRVKTLEDHVGGLLFDRSRRQVTTTELGMLLLPYAQDVLDRAERLREVARAAGESAVRAVGVPADCDPAALARVIRAGTEHGTLLAVHELPPEARAAGMAGGSLGYALLRVPPENATLRVPLGLASAPPEAPAGTTGHGPVGGARSRPRVVHLEGLRPRRGRDARGHQPAPVPIRTTAEDAIRHAQDRLGRAVARAGLPTNLVRPAESTATALAETLAGRAMLLCAEPFARRHGADWAPLGEESLHRGYNIAVAQHRQRAVDAPGWLVTMLAAAVGAATAPATAATGAAGEDTRTRLAALG